MAAKTGAERVKAARIRKKQALEGELLDDEAAFLDDYEEDAADSPPMSPEPIDASASKERVVHIEERTAAAQGKHVHPDAYAAVATANGLRADTLLRICTTALVAVNEQYRVMNEHLLERTTRIEDAHVAMLEAVRENYLGRIEAEAEAKLTAAAASAAQAAGGDDSGELFEMFKFWMAAREHAQNGGGKKKPKKKPTRNGKPLGAL